LRSDSLILNEDDDDGYLKLTESFTWPSKLCRLRLTFQLFLLQYVKTTVNYASWRNYELFEFSLNWVDICNLSSVISIQTK